MAPRIYSDCRLDEQVVWFIHQQDPLARGFRSLECAISTGCQDIAAQEIRKHLDLSQARERDILEEACARTRLRLWRMLMKAQQSGDDHFLHRGAEPLVRALAQRSLVDVFRDQRPEGYRLQCQVDYILEKHHDRFGFVSIGLLPRSKRYGLADGGYRDDDSRIWDRDQFEGQMLGTIDPREVMLPELLRKLVQWHGRPMAKAELLSCVKDLQPVLPWLIPLDDSNSELGDDDQRLREIEAAVEIGRSLEWLWIELKELPPEQRTAILWRMDADGLHAIATQVGYDEVAGALNIDAETLMKLAQNIPLEFEKVAELMGLTSQQARSRRARGWDRIRRSYEKWARDCSDQLSLLEMWLSKAHTEPSSVIEVG